MEAISINLVNQPKNAKINYQTHVQDIGWQAWVSDGQIAGTTGKKKKIEALEIKLIKS